MDGGDHRQTSGAAEQGPHHVAPGAVAVDDLIPPLPDEPLEGGKVTEQVFPREYHGGDAQRPGLVGEGALHEGDHGDLHAWSTGEALQQSVDMGLGAAAVAAGYEMDDLHVCLRKKYLSGNGGIWYNSRRRCVACGR